MRFSLFILCWIFSFSAFALPSWIDSSHTILLPTEVSRPLSATSQFPLFWWNFIVLQVGDDSWGEVDQFCREMASRTQGLVIKSACGTNLSQFREILFGWAEDQIRREPAPSEAQLRAAMDEALSKASLPSEPFLLSLFRSDPMASYRKLQSLLDSRVQLTLEKKRGYFFDPETKRVIIPIQLNFPPAETEKTKSFLAAVDQSMHGLSDLHWLGMIGPQSSTMINERQIRHDVEIIGWVGTILLFAQIGATILLRRWRLLLLVPPILLSTALATFITYLIFGSIHGLTLAFGPGIVGLALDHGLHSCLNTKWKGAWRANWYGLLTTIVALAVMLFSAIPFLRQLMAFSIIGLVLGFAVYWFLHRRFTSVFQVEPFAIEPRTQRWHFVFLFLTVVGLVLGGIFLRPNFGMQQMNYQTQEDFELTKWFFTHLKAKSPLLQVYGEKGLSPLEPAQEQKEFAAKNGLDVENVVGYLPIVKTQQENLESWRKLCAMKISPTEKTFFAPFWKNVCGLPAVAEALARARAPVYVRDLTNDGKWVSLWLTTNAEEARSVKAAYPDAKSLPEIVSLFQTLLERETAWMAPLAILLAMALLWNYYRKMHLVLLSLVPFCVGIGLFAGVAVLFQFNLSFISLIALVMVFGLSLDYGIFATNLYSGQTGLSGPGVWTSVVLAAIVTFLGFLPLIFCHHPVLVHLGQALVFGTAGTIFGSVWGIPCVEQLYRKLKS
jgi:hypothetical protein